MWLSCARTVEMCKGFLVSQAWVVPLSLAHVTIFLRFIFFPKFVYFFCIFFIWLFSSKFHTSTLTFLQPGEEPCPLDPWVVVTDKSKYVDQQTLKLQENPEVMALVNETELIRLLLIYLNIYLVGGIFSFGY